MNRAAGERAQQQGDAEERRAGRDGGHDRLQAAIDDDQAVERTAGEAGQQHAEDAERRLQRRADDDVGGDAVAQDEDHADRQVDAGGQDHKGLRDRDQRQQHALVRGGGDHVGVEAGRVVAGIDHEHDDEDRERQQRAALLAEPVAPIARMLGGECVIAHHPAPAPARLGVPVSAWLAPRLSALPTSARSVISDPVRTRPIAPSYITSTLSQQPTSSS